VFGKGNRVVIERVDKWDWDGSSTWQLKLHACGMFELTEDGKIYESQTGLFPSKRKLDSVASF
jgi:limonene-1,2-epoxide hydrolase